MTSVARPGEPTSGLARGAAGLMVLWPGLALGHGFPMKTAYSMDAFVVPDVDGVEVRLTFEVPVVEATQELWARYGVRGAGPEELEVFTRNKLVELEDFASVSIDGGPVEVAWAARPGPANGRAVGGFVFYYLDGRIDWPGGPLVGSVELEVHLDGWYDKDVYLSGGIDPIGAVEVLRDGPSGWMVRDECLYDGTDHPGEGAFAEVLRVQRYRLGAA